MGDVCVLGMGGTGAAVCRYLAAQLGGRVSSVTLFGGASSAEGDLSRELEAAGVACRLGTEKIDGAFDLAVVSPGISEFSDFFAAARAHAAEVIGEPEFAWRESPANWVAITGTNGKTTTTKLTAHLLAAAGMDATAVGNIGTIVTSQIENRAADNWFVAELELPAGDSQAPAPPRGRPSQHHARPRGVARLDGGLCRRQGARLCQHGRL